jgi:riboflavin kinase / FMN adenylyltransferase
VSVRRWRGLDAAPGDWGRSVVTIGVFDGVHRGHQSIIGHAVQRAGETEVPSVVLSFDPHPAEVVRPGSHPPVLTTARRKADLLEQLGVDVFWVLPFTREFSRLPADEFVHTVLVERLHAATVVVGENFRFGHKAAGDVAMLRELGAKFGFAVEPAPLLTEQGTTFSSTYIRSCIAAGDITAATAALGREHRVEGIVVRGDGRGRDLGYPTANLEPVPYAAVPADGVYAGWLVRRGDRLPAAVSVGTNPTFSGQERRLEAYVLDVDVDLYGEHVGVDFATRLRPMERFDSVDALIERIDADVVRTRELLGG